MNTHSQCPRIDSIDLTRGLIMIMMAIDHAAIMVGKSRYIEGVHWDTASQAHVFTQIAPFLTKQLPNLCAVGFSFFLGLGMILFHESRRSANWHYADSFLYYAKRGLLLLVLQFTYENVIWWIGYGPLLPPYFGILYALGTIMIFASLAIRFSAKTLFLLAGTVQIICILFIRFAPLWEHVPILSSILRVGVVSGTDQYVSVYFPALPWFAFAFSGMGCGKLLIANRAQFFRFLPLCAISMLAIAICIRVFTGSLFNYVDLSTTSFMSFFNMPKFPPSLAFGLFFLGIDLLLFYYFEKVSSAFPTSIFLSPLRTLGKSAMFFYLAHLLLYALLGIPFAPEGGSLFLVYIVLVIGLALLIPMCKRFALFKSAKPADSLWRMF